MHHRLCLAALALLVAAGPALAAETMGQIERLDPRFDEIVPKDAKIEKLGEGYDWAEGPVWDKARGCLLFSDVPRNHVLKFAEGKGVSEFLSPSGYTGNKPRGGEPGSNGLVIDAQGRLILCQHGDRQVARLNADKTFHTLADRYEGKRFNSPNDAALSRAGDLYFTDPPYGLLGLNDDPAKELKFNGVYRLSKDGELKLLTKEMSFPNGIAITPDEKQIYVANSDPKKAIWMVFDLGADGGLSHGRVFYDATRWAGQRKGLPDGMKVDAKGNVFATGPGGVLVFAPDGALLGRIDPGEATANCAWGDDGSTLYLAADMYLCRIKLDTKGVGF